jgi:2-iminobutanoate/2-iminopropanoate deaminase
MSNELVRRQFLKTGVGFMSGAGMTTLLGNSSTVLAQSENSSFSLQEVRPMKVERKNYPHLDKPVGPYVHAVSHNGLLFLSGITAFGTPAQNRDLALQAQAVFDQIKSILEAEGTGLESLIKVTIFVTEFREVDQLRAVLFSSYKGNLPASSLIQVNRLFAPELKIEVEAIAALADS